MTFRLLLLLLAAWAALARAAPEQAAGNSSSSHVYNDYMASLSTAPETFAGSFGEYHALLADDVPALRQSDAQMQLLSLRPCSVFAPHYQTNCGETLYVKSGVMNVALLVDGTRLSRGLRAGDVMTVPAGAMHAYMNTGCVDTEAVILFDAATPHMAYPVDQALSLPQQPIISSFGLTNYTAFQDRIRLPQSHLYSLNDRECTLRCAALANRTRAPGGAAADAAPAPAAAAPQAAEAAAAAEAAGGTGGAAAAAAGRSQPRRHLAAAREAAAAAAAAAAAGGQAGPQAAAAAAAVDAAAQPGALRRLAQAVWRRAGGAPSVDARPGGTGQQQQQQRLQQSDFAPYNDYMASLAKAPLDVESEYASWRALTYKVLPGLERTDSEAVLTELGACSMSALHFQTDSDEFTTVLSGTVDMILMPNGTRKVVRTMQPDDVAVIPRGVVHYFANANCETTTLLVLFNSKAASRIYPMTDLMDMPASVETAAFGLQGGAAAYSAWASTISVPDAQLASLNDPQCTTRCEEEAAAALADGGPQAALGGAR